MGSPLVPVLAYLFIGVKNCGWKIFKALKFYFIVDMLTTLFVYFTLLMALFVIFLNFVLV